MVLPPLMHGAAQWACHDGAHHRAAVVFSPDTNRLDADEVVAHDRTGEGAWR